MINHLLLSNYFRLLHVNYYATLSPIFKNPFLKMIQKIEKKIFITKYTNITFNKEIIRIKEQKTDLNKNRRN